MTRISLCMIVRNEAAFLEGCLRSVADLVDEMIVVDTGSTDKTPDIARSLGAQVVNHCWNDHFAEARNAALPHVTGDWVLVLDADERLAPDGVAVLREACESGDFDGAMLPLYDALDTEVDQQDLADKPDRFKAPVFLYRLFRMDGSLRWKNSIHESVVWLKEPGRRLIRLKAPLIHYGNVPEVRRRYGKNERNFRMLEQAWQNDPDDIMTLTYYLGECFRKDKGERTRELADKAWLGLQTHFAMPDARKHPRFLSAITARIWFLMRDHRYDEALDACSEASSWGIAHPNLTWLTASCMESLAYRTTDRKRFRLLLERARETFELCLSFHGRTFTSEVHPGVTSWQSEQSLGRVLLRLGEPTTARHHFQAVLDSLEGESFESERRTALLGVIESHVDEGDFRVAMRLIRKSLHIAEPDLAVLRADVYERMGKLDNCIDQLKQTMEQKKVPPFLVTSCEARLRELICLVNLYRGHLIPGKGPMGLLAAVLAGKDWHDLQPAHQLEEARTTRLIRYLIESQGPAYLARFQEPEAQSTLPQLTNLVRTLLATKDML